MSQPLFAIGAVVALIYGATIGSFLNVCIHRLPRAESLWSPPSHCPACKTRLQARDLIPILSYLLLRGRCRTCGVRITPRYAIIEFATALLFVAVWVSLALRVPDLLAGVPGLLLVVAALVWVAAMVVTFMIDLETTYVIEPVTWVAMGAGVLFEVIFRWAALEPVAAKIGSLELPYVPMAVPGMLIGFLVFMAIDLFGGLIFRKPSMGVGDSYIGAAIGAMLGPGLALLSFGMAVGVAAVIGIVVLAAAARRPRKAKSAPAGDDLGPEPPHYLPLKPFLAAGTAFALLWLLQGAVGRGLAARFGPDDALVGLVAPVLFGAAVVVMLVLLAPLWPTQTVETVEEETQQVTDDLPQGNYMPFGPFLTACAVLIALAPEWFADTAETLWQAYLHMF